MRYIFFDIETTNERLDFEIDKSELIEIGAYEPATGLTFQTFIKSSHSLSEFTQRLTGIMDSDLQNAPDIDEAIQNFLTFLGDPKDIILLGHNIEGFDIPILSRYDKVFSKIQYLDTLQLFLFLYPGLPEYNAEFLYKYFFNKPDHKEQHRGLQDAKEESELFDKCLNLGAIRTYWDQKELGSLTFAHILREEHKKNIKSQTKNHLNLMGDRSEFKSNNYLYKWISDLFPTIDTTPYKQREYLSKKVLFKKFFHAFDYEKDKKKEYNYENTISLDERSLHDAYIKILGEKQTRAEQREIITDLQKVFNQEIEEKLSGIEAGTGTGKTYGYLVPTYTFLDNNPTYKVFISTYTKLLQSQIINKDIGVITPLFSNVKAAHLKANNEGLDLVRIPLSSKSHTLYTLMLWNWICTGHYYLSDIPYPITKNLNVQNFLYDPFYFRDSEDYNKYFGFKGKLQSQIANHNLLIVNHHFFLSQIGGRSREPITGFSSPVHKAIPYQYFSIFDEGHNLESVLRDYETLHYDMAMFKRLLYFLDTQNLHQQSLFLEEFKKERKNRFINIKDKTISDQLLELREQEDRKLFDDITKIQLSEIYYALEKMLPNTDIYRFAKKEIEELREKYDINIRNCGQKELYYNYFIDSQNFFKKLLKDLKEVVGLYYKHFHKQHQDCLNISKKLNLNEEEVEPIKESQLLQIGSFLRKGIDFLDQRTVPGDQSYFIQGEVEFKKGTSEIENFGFKMIPIDLTTYTAFLQRSQKSCILSATLLDPSCNFSYILSELTGQIKREEKNYHIFPLIKSPFDYSKNRDIEIADIPLGIPSTFPLKEAKIIEKIGHYGGRSLVLTTNNTDKDLIANALHQHFNSEGIMVLKHEGGSINSRANQQKIKALIKNPKTILVGSKSYMEGVDVPGENLSLVILRKLPFLPPEPFILYQNEKPLYKRLDNQYVYHFLCGIIFKQAIGRLIRTETDQGEILILDPRINDNNGSFFLKYLE